MKKKLIHCVSKTNLLLEIIAWMITGLTISVDDRVKTFVEKYNNNNNNQKCRFT